MPVPGSMHEVHLFNASAVATATSTGRYQSGDRHAVLVFLRQREGTDHDWEIAEGQLNYAGWTQVKFSGADTIGAESLTGNAAYLLGAYEQAVQHGFGLVVFEKPVTEDEER
jgi:hypothetical protein